MARKLASSKNVPATRGSTDLAKMPEGWFDEMAKEAVEGQARIPVTTSRKISIRGGKFTMGDKILTAPLRVIIVDFARERSFYPGAYDPNHITSPDCFALSYGKDEAGNLVNEETMIPHEASQNLQSDKCSTCPQNAWGSSKNSASGRRKACNSNVRLHLLEADSQSIDDAQTAGMTVPVMSAKNLAAYISDISSKSNNAAAYFGVITEINFEPKATYPLLTFKAVAQVKDRRTAEIILAQRKLAKDILLQPFAPKSDEPAQQTRGGGKSERRTTEASKPAPKKRAFGK